MVTVNDMLGQSFGGFKVSSSLRAGRDPVYVADSHGQQVELILSRRGDAEPGDQERCARRAELASQIDHPNAATVVGSGQERGFHWLAIESTGYPTLADLMATRKMGVDEAVAVAMQIVAALRAAHAVELLHADLRAEHVRVGPEGQVVVAGFGTPLALTGPVLTRIDEIVGTAEHMAPEQILGDPLGPATDLYAVGLLLYRMVTGQLPFSSAAPATLIYHQLNDLPQTPSLLNAAVPPALDHLLTRLLAKVPDQRLGNATQALSELEAISRRHQLNRVDHIRDADVEEQQQQADRHRRFEPRFVGRQGDLEHLRRQAQQAAAGNGCAVFTSGEAGIGKTRLIDAAADGWTADGQLVVRGNCCFGAPLGPYVPILEAMSHLLADEHGLSIDGRRALADGLSSWAPTLSALVTTSPTALDLRTALANDFGDAGGGSAEQIRFLDAIHDIFAAAAAHQPLVVVLEDLHWSDAGTMRVLRHLSLHMSDTPILLVGTYRPEDLLRTDNVDLSNLMADWMGQGSCTQIELGRLSRSEMKWLACSLFHETEFTAAFDDYLYRQCQGNPFIATEVLKLLRSRHAILSRNGVWLADVEYDHPALPARVEALVHERLEALSSEERQLLQLAAVAGASFTPALLGRASGLSRVELLGMLFHLERVHRLLTPTSDGGFTFSHSVIREVLYGELPGELCREYHRLLAVLLRDGTGTADDDLGRHLFIAEQYGEALPYLLQAADEAERLFSWYEAARLSDDAFTAARACGATVDVQLTALSRAGKAYGRLPDYDAAMARMQQVRELATGNGQSLQAAQALWDIGDLELQHGHLDSAGESFADVAVQLASLEPGTEPGATLDLYAANLSAWGSVDFEAGRLAQAAQRWQEANDLLADGGSAAERSNVLNNLAVLATVRGDLDRAWWLYEQALAQDSGQPTSNTVMTLYNMGMLRADQERWNESLALYDQALDMCRRGRFLVHEPVIDLNRAEAFIGRGEMGAARTALSRALLGFRRLDDALGTADTLRLYGRLCRTQQEWVDGHRYLEQSIEINRRFGDTVSLGEALCEMGELNRDSGSTEAALASLREAEAIFARVDARPDLERVRHTLNELAAV